MARFRSDQDYPITVSDLGRVVGPRQEFDWPGYDPAVHGVIPGCTRLDEPEEPAANPSGPPPGPEAGKPSAPASGPPGPDDSNPQPATAPDGAASKETQQ